MIKNWKITVVFIIGSIIASAIINPTILNNSNVGKIIGTITGSTLILFLIPLLLTYFVKVTYKLFKFKLEGNGFAYTYLIAWVLIAFLTFKGSFYNHPKETTNLFLYHPKGSFYSVEFNRKPTISSIAFPTGSYFTKGESATVLLSKFGSMERANFYLLNKSFLNLLNKKTIYTIFNNYCEKNGLIYPEFKFEKINNEKDAELRTYKQLTDKSGKKRELTIVAKVYIKGDNYFATYVSSESKDFPTPEIVRFWHSLKKK